MQDRLNILNIILETIFRVSAFIIILLLTNSNLNAFEFRYIMKFNYDPESTYAIPLSHDQEHAAIAVNFEEEDLLAQRSMAESTEKMLYVSLIQIVLSVIGTIIVLYSLHLNRCATNAAITTSKIAADQFAADRPWISLLLYSAGPFINSIYDEKMINNGIIFRFTWINSGRSPALNIKAHTYIIALNREDYPLDAPIDYEMIFEHSRISRKINSDENVSALGPNMEFSSGVVILDDRDASLFREHKSRVFVYACVQYKDIYSTEMRKSECTYEFFYQSDTPQTGGAFPMIAGIARGPQNTMT